MTVKQLANREKRDRLATAMNILLVAGERNDLNTPENKVRQNLNFSIIKKLILSLTGMVIISAMALISCQKDDVLANITAERKPLNR